MHRAGRGKEVVREARPDRFKKSHKLWLMEPFSSTPLRLREFKHFSGSPPFSAHRNAPRVTASICLESNRNKRCKTRRREKSKWAKITLEKVMFYYINVQCLCLESFRIAEL